MKERCAWHEPDQLGYVAKSLDADRRLQRGEKQRYCRTCKRHYWPHEWGTKP